MEFCMDAVGVVDEVTDNKAMPDFNEESPGDNIDTTPDLDIGLNKSIKPEPEAGLDSFKLYEEANPPPTMKKR